MIIFTRNRKSFTNDQDFEKIMKHLMKKIMMSPLRHPRCMAFLLLTLCAVLLVNRPATAKTAATTPHAVQTITLSHPAANSALLAD